MIEGYLMDPGFLKIAIEYVSSAMKAGRFCDLFCEKRILQCVLIDTK
jgi:hypothetical protein